MYAILNSKPLLKLYVYIIFNKYNFKTKIIVHDACAFFEKMPVCIKYNDIKYI